MSDKFSEGYDLRSSVRIIIQQKAWYITYRDRPSMKNEHAWIWKTMDVLLLLPHKITSLSLSESSTRLLNLQKDSVQNCLASKRFCKQHFQLHRNTLLSFLFTYIFLSIYSDVKNLYACAWTPAASASTKSLNHFFVSAPDISAAFKFRHISALWRTGDLRREINEDCRARTPAPLSLLSPVRLCCKHAPRLSASIFPAPCQPSIAASKDHPPEMLLISSYHYLAV